MKKSLFNIASKFRTKNVCFTGIVKDGTMYFTDGANIAAVKVNAVGEGAIDIDDLKKVYTRGEADQFVFSDGKTEVKIGAKSFKFRDYLESVELLLPEPKNKACESFNFPD